MRIGSAENGCFIKTRPGRNGESAWINMVANFNLTWKSACLEILNYVSQLSGLMSRCSPVMFSSRSARLVRLLRSARHPSYGGSGPAPKTTSRLTGSGPAVKQLKRKTTSSTGNGYTLCRQCSALNRAPSSLGERYGLRIIPGQNSFLVLPNNISRSTAVGAILNPAGPAHSHTPGGPAWISADAMDLEDAAHVDFVLAVSKDEKLMRRLNDLDNAETCSTTTQSTDAKWKLRPEEVLPVLNRFAETK